VAQFEHGLPASGSASGHHAVGGMHVVDSTDHQEPLQWKVPVPASPQQPSALE